MNFEFLLIKEDLQGISKKLAFAFKRRKAIIVSVSPFSACLKGRQILGQGSGSRMHRSAAPRLHSDQEQGCYQLMFLEGITV